MGSERIFVGRKSELERFGEVLAELRGQAVVVVGNRGMGKTWLVDEMGEAAYGELDLECGWVRYEVTPNDTPNSIMALMMDNAFDAAVSGGAVKNPGRRKKQWLALLKTMVPKGGGMAELAKSLGWDVARNTREQFLERLGLISRLMPENGRAIFVVDPEKYMCKDSDQDWAIVVRGLPERIKFVFAQRPEDVIAGSEVFEALDNVVMIPEGGLGPFDEAEVVELAGASLANEGAQQKIEIKEWAKESDRVPYTVGGAVRLLGESSIGADELAKYLTEEEIVKAEWRGICDKGDEAKELFEAYAVLEVGVPGDVVEVVSRIDAMARMRLEKDRFLRGLLREEEGGKRIYHAILADFVLDQIGQQEKEAYHSRAVGVYRGKLAQAKKEQRKPDELSAVRLAEHVLATHGEKAFVEAFVNECTQPLVNLGLLDAAMGLSERGLGVVEKGSGWEAAILGNLGLLHTNKNELDKAEEMGLKSLEIYEKLGSQGGMANCYGCLGLIYRDKNELEKAEEMFKESLAIGMAKGMLELTANMCTNLGGIYLRRGELEKAQEMHVKSLEISKKLGWQEGMANSYGNLGGIHCTRGELDKAEEMFKEVLEIEDSLGRAESTANAYSNLGTVYRERGDKIKARGYWEEALGLYERIGMPDRVEEVEGWIEGAKE